MQQFFNIKNKIIHLVDAAEGVDATVDFKRRGKNHIARVKVNGVLSTEKGVGTSQIDAMENLYLVLYNGYNSVLDEFLGKDSSN